MEEIATAFAWEGGDADTSFAIDYANVQTICCELHHKIAVVGEKRRMEDQH